MVFIAHAEGGRLGHGDAVQQLQVFAKVDVVGIRVGHPSVVGRDRLQRDQAVGLRDSAQRLQQDGIDPSEGSCAGADADGQREDRNSRKRGIARHHAQAVVEVLQEAFQPGQDAAFAIRLPRLFHAAEANERLTPGFLGTEAGANAVFNVEVDVAREFVCEISVVAPRAEQTAEPQPECSEFAHHASSLCRGQEARQDGGGLLPLCGGSASIGAGRPWSTRSILRGGCCLKRPNANG